MRLCWLVGPANNDPHMTQDIAISSLEPVAQSVGPAVTSCGIVPTPLSPAGTEYVIYPPTTSAHISPPPPPPCYSAARRSSLMKAVALLHWPSPTVKKLPKCWCRENQLYTRLAQLTLGPSPVLIFFF